MSRSRPERTYKALPRRRGASPIALAPAHGAGRGTVPKLSRRRYQQRPSRSVASGLVMNTVVLDGGAFWFTIPNGNRPRSWRLKYNLANCVANHLRHAASGPRRGHAQRVKLLLAQVDLSFFHVCHFHIIGDIRQ